MVDRRPWDIALAVPVGLFLLLRSSVGSYLIFSNFQVTHVRTRKLLMDLVLSAWTYQPAGQLSILKKVRTLGAVLVILTPKGRCTFNWLAMVVWGILNL